MRAGNGSAFCIATTISPRRRKGWANHATVMGYFLHRIKNERSLYRGRKFAAERTVFCAAKLFTDVSADLGDGEDASLTYRITPNEIAPTEYPLKVSLALTYTLRGERAGRRFPFQNTNPN